MPSASERRDIVEIGMAMAASQAPAVFAENLPLTGDRQLYDYLLNLEVAARASDRPVNFPDIAPGFGLLLIKTQDWLPGTAAELPEPLSRESIEAMEKLLAGVATALLPEQEEPVYQHFETSDGLICCLYRMKDQAAIFAAAGVDPNAVARGAVPGTVQ